MRIYRIAIAVVVSVLILSVGFLEPVFAATGYGPGAQPNVPPFVPPSVSRPASSSQERRPITRQRIPRSELVAARERDDVVNITNNTTLQGTAATIQLTNAEVQQLIQSSSGRVVEFDLSSSPVETVHIPRNAIELISDAGYAIEVDFPSGTIRIDSSALQSMLAQGVGRDLTIVLVEIVDITDELPRIMRDAVLIGEEVYVIRVYLGTQRIGHFDGIMTVTLLFDGPFPATVWHLSPEGVRTRTISGYNPNAGTVTFITSQLSHYILGSDGVPGSSVMQVPPHGGDVLPTAPLNNPPSPQTAVVGTPANQSVQTQQSQSSQTQQTQGSHSSHTPASQSVAAQSPATQPPLSPASGNDGIANAAAFVDFLGVGGRSVDDPAADITARENPQTGINPAILSVGTLGFGVSGMAGLMFYLRYRVQSRHNRTYTSSKNRKKRLDRILGNDLLS